MAGYSMRVVMALQNGDSSHVEVRFGRHCVRHNIAVERIAAKLGVTRMSVYNWFLNGVRARPAIAARMEELLSDTGWTGA